jgi:hypothetical protein
MDSLFYRQYIELFNDGNDEPLETLLATLIDGYINSERGYYLKLLTLFNEADSYKTIKWMADKANGIYEQLMHDRDEEINHELSDLFMYMIEERWKTEKLKSFIIHGRYQIIKPLIESELFYLGLDVIRNKLVGIKLIPNLDEKFLNCLKIIRPECHRGLLCFIEKFNFIYPRDDLIKKDTMYIVVITDFKDGFIPLEKYIKEQTNNEHTLETKSSFDKEIQFTNELERLKRSQFLSIGDKEYISHQMVEIIVVLHRLAVSYTTNRIQDFMIKPDTLEIVYINFGECHASTPLNYNISLNCIAGVIETIFRAGIDDTDNSIFENLVQKVKKMS